jgi:hypothetical protein
MARKNPTWKSNLLVAVAALCTLVLADVALQGVAPRVWRKQVQDGVAELAQGNPRILSLSSSHGRSMDVVARHLAQRTGEPGRMISVSMEGGKATHFQFVLDERLRALIEEEDAQGRPVRDRLQRFLLVTEWWDSCSWEPGRPKGELPSHAWEWRHFLSDAARRGVNGENRNFLRWRWKRLLRYSTLATDRGPGAIVDNLAAAARGVPPGRNPQQEAAFVQWWQDYNEGGDACLFGADQLAAYRHVLDYAKARGLDITIVIFAKKPLTLTPKAVNGTLAHFAAGMRRIADEYGARLIDITMRSPLTDEDFMADFDHVNASGNEKLASWLLDHDFAFLAEDAQPTMSAVGARQRVATHAAGAVVR